MEKEKSIGLAPRQILEMSLVMAKIGCFTFGGGWSILAQMQNEFHDKRGWVSQEQLMDFASVGRSLPGIMILNITTLFGYHMAGAVGSLAAVLGLVIPPIVVMSVLTSFYTLIRDNQWVAKALVGIRAAVVPIIMVASMKLTKTALARYSSYLIMAAAFLLCYFTSLNNVVIVLLGAGAGLILKGGEKKDAIS